MFQYGSSKKQTSGIFSNLSILTSFPGPTEGDWGFGEHPETTSLWDECDGVPASSHC